MHRAQDKPAQAATALQFFAWALAEGDPTAAKLDYVPMPASVKTVIQQSWGAIQDPAGKAIALK